ncbi:hypothetical protein PSN13_03587 [Micromonospora saelicesensis]|uniref:Uncharacterized protein n=1 Tax=Micromonospora saelicesensis TaxID=285676 RepID=A0A328NJL5_9ACTN|nr:hypothetical protein PSN13_03587 [Micromonospora saelicesensis]
MGHGRHQRRAGVVLGRVDVGGAEAVGPHLHRGEVHVALHLRVRPVERQVVGQLTRVLPVRPVRRIAALVVGLADVELHAGAAHRLGPPRHEARVVGGRVLADVPVELRHHVVDPLLLDPLAGVGRDDVVRLAAGGVRTERVDGLVAPDAERADAELYPRLGRLDLAVHLLDQQVDVVPPPVGPVGEAPVVGREGRVVRHLVGAAGVGVEVVVEVDAIDVVPLDGIHHGGLDELADLGDPGVVVEPAAGDAGRWVGEGPVGVLLRRVAGGELGEVGAGAAGGGHRDAVRVEPGVELQVPLVRLVDQEGQWVPARVLAAYPGQVFRPGLVRRGPERVGGGPDLHHDGVVVQAPGQVEQLAVLGLLGGDPVRVGLGRLAGPVDVDHRRDPHGPELPFRGGRVGGAGGGAGGVGRAGCGARGGGADERAEQGCDQPGDSESGGFHAVCPFVGAPGCFARCAARFAVDVRVAGRKFSQSRHRRKSWWLTNRVGG